MRPKKPDQNPVFLTVAEAAKRAGRVSDKTIRRWIDPRTPAEDRLPSYQRKKGALILILESDLVDFLLKKKKK